MNDEVDEKKEQESADADADWGAALEEQESAEADADWGDALEEQAVAEAETAKTDDDFEKPELQTLEEDAAINADDVNLNVIMEIPVTLSMEIGRTQISIRNLLQLNQGSVVELDRLAGEPMDVMVNGTLVAHGEVVVVNEKFGIRLTDIISPQERVKKLR